MTNAGNTMTQRYATLPFIALILRLLGYLYLIYSIGKMALIAFASQAFEDVPTRIMRIFDALFYGILLCGLMIAVSECLHLLMDVESHTRRAADAACGTITGTTPRRNSGDKRE